MWDGYSSGQSRGHQPPKWSWSPQDHPERGGLGEKGVDKKMERVSRRRPRRMGYREMKPMKRGWPQGQGMPGVRAGAVSKVPCLGEFAC